MYDSLEAELHDSFWNAEGPAAELPLLRDFHTRYPGPALEVGCGSGRLLFPLLREGFQIAGLDNAAAMIALARESARAEGMLPKLYQEELADHRPGFPYQAITLPAFTIQLFENPAEALRDISARLGKDGALYLTVFYPWAEVMGDLPKGERYLDHELVLADGTQATIHTEHELDEDALRLTRHHFYEMTVKGAETRKYQSTQVLRYCQEDEWQDLLAATGFKIERVIHDFDPELTEDEDSAGVTTFLAIKEPSLTLGQ